MWKKKRKGKIFLKNLCSTNNTQIYISGLQLSIIFNMTHLL